MNAMNAAFYSLRIAIIEDLPKPVKIACDALPSAVLSDNAVKAAEIRTRRAVTEGNYWGFVRLNRFK